MPAVRGSMAAAAKVEGAPGRFRGYCPHGRSLVTVKVTDGRIRDWKVWGPFGEEQVLALAGTSVHVLEGLGEALVPEVRGTEH